MGTVELIDVLDAGVDRFIDNFIALDAPKGDCAGAAIALCANDFGAAGAHVIAEVVSNRDEHVFSGHPVLFPVDVQKDEVSHPLSPVARRDAPMGRPTYFAI